MFPAGALRLHPPHSRRTTNASRALKSPPRMLAIGSSCLPWRKPAVSHRPGFHASLPLFTHPATSLASTAVHLVPRLLFDFSSALLPHRGRSSSTEMLPKVEPAKNATRLLGGSNPDSWRLVLPTMPRVAFRIALLCFPSAVRNFRSRPKHWKELRRGASQGTPGMSARLPRVAKRSQVARSGSRGCLTLARRPAADLTDHRLLLVHPTAGRLSRPWLPGIPVRPSKSAKLRAMQIAW